MHLAAAGVLTGAAAVVHHAASPSTWLAAFDCSVVFSFLGRDFYNALSERDVAAFKMQLIKYLVGFVLGIPVFVYSDYLQVMIALTSLRAGVCKGNHSYAPLWFIMHWFSQCIVYGICSMCT